MSNEVIEVCQDCGHLIDNPPIEGPDGRRYLIRLCLRDECIIEQLRAESAAILRRDIERNAARAKARAWGLTIPVIDPRAAFRITGV